MMGTKQRKQNEMRTEENRRLILQHPVNLGGDAQSLRNTSTKFQLKSIFSPHMYCHPGAGRIWPQCRSPARSIPQSKAAQTQEKGTDLAENRSTCASAAAHLVKTVKSQSACAELVMEVALSECHQTSITLPGSISQSYTNLTQKRRPDGDSFPCKWQRMKSTMCLKAQAEGTKLC